MDAVQRLGYAEVYEEELTLWQQLHLLLTFIPATFFLWMAKLFGNPEMVSKAQKLLPSYGRKRLIIKGKEVMCEEHDIELRFCLGDNEIYFFTVGYGEWAQLYAYRDEVVRIEMPGPFDELFDQNKYGDSWVIELRFKDIDRLYLIPGGDPKKLVMLSEVQSDISQYLLYFNKEKTRFLLVIEPTDVDKNNCSKEMYAGKSHVFELVLNGDHHTLTPRHRNIDFIFDWRECSSENEAFFYLIRTKDKATFYRTDESEPYASDIDVKNDDDWSLDFDTESDGSRHRFAIAAKDELGYFIELNGERKHLKLCESIAQLDLTPNDAYCVYVSLSESGEIYLVHRFSDASDIDSFDTRPYFRQQDSEPRYSYTGSVVLAVT